MRSRHPAPLANEVAEDVRLTSAWYGKEDVYRDEHEEAEVQGTQASNSCCTADPHLDSYSDGFIPRSTRRTKAAIDDSMMY